MLYFWNTELCTKSVQYLPQLLINRVLIPISDKHPRHFYMLVTSRKFVISAVKIPQNLIFENLIRCKIIYEKI